MVTSIVPFVTILGKKQRRAPILPENCVKQKREIDQKPSIKRGSEHYSKIHGFRETYMTNAY